MGYATAGFGGGVLPPAALLAFSRGGQLAGPLLCGLWTSVTTEFRAAVCCLSPGGSSALDFDQTR